MSQVISYDDLICEKERLLDIKSKAETPEAHHETVLLINNINDKIINYDLSNDDLFKCESCLKVHDIEDSVQQANGELFCEQCEKKNGEPKQEKSINLMEQALISLIKDVQATGLISFSDGLHAPKADPTWIDLGETVVKAHKALELRGINMPLEIDEVDYPSEETIECY